MKYIKFIITPVIACLLLFASCENDSQTVNENQLDSIKVEERNANQEFDFSALEKINEDELNDIEAGLIEAGKEISLIKEIQNFDTEEVPDLSAINDYLRYKGASPIDTERFYYQTEEIIRNPDAKATDLTQVLSETNMYSDAQLNLFLELDAQMSKASSFEESMNILDSFKRNVSESKELPSFEKNTMLLYASSMKGLMYTDYTSQKGFRDCINCVYRNKWRILGWGVFRSLPKVIFCIFTNLGNAWGMIWCILKALGSGIAYTFKAYCGKFC
ncbi:hypothetical protein [Aquimarina algicola]|uniref:Uncharacterized protein n=1 Tax=Aquimarina algicola TaxID=2589995 RepID=A0A504JJI3_9FLAO|nr:hypothetical protein [Aquimarina algicola]TPN87773.1 hypothetical protein FHK87_09370 [Aquimarina algicola]